MNHYIPFGTCQDPSCPFCQGAYAPSPYTDPCAPLQGDPEVSDKDKASLAYFLSDPSCKSLYVDL